MQELLVAVKLLLILSFAGVTEDPLPTAYIGVDAQSLALYASPNDSYFQPTYILTEGAKSDIIAVVADGEEGDVWVVTGHGWVQCKEEGDDFRVVSHLDHTDLAHC